MIYFDFEKLGIFTKLAPNWALFLRRKNHFFSYFWFLKLQTQNRFIKPSPSRDQFQSILFIY